MTYSLGKQKLIIYKGLLNIDCFERLPNTNNQLQTKHVNVVNVARLHVEGTISPFCCCSVVASKWS